MAAWLVVVGCFAKTTPEVIACEEAYARLASCCPGFDPVVRGGDPQSELCIDEDYDYTESDGCGTTTEKGHASPAFTAAESACIENTSCNDLVANGVCTRAQKQRQRGAGSYAEDEEFPVVHDSNSVDGDAQPAVCP